MDVSRMILPKNAGDDGMLHFWVFERGDELGGSHEVGAKNCPAGSEVRAAASPCSVSHAWRVRQHPTFHEYWISPSAPYSPTIKPYSL